MTDLTSTLTADLTALKERALARRAELLTELEEVDDILQRLGETPRRHRPANPSGDVIVHAVRDLILNAGRPMTPKELVAGLDAVGVTLLGKNREAVLATKLWRAGRALVTKAPAVGYSVPELDATLGRNS